MKVVLVVLALLSLLAVPPGRQTAGGSAAPERTRIHARSAVSDALWVRPGVPGTAGAKRNAIADQVNGARWHGVAEDLARFGTRYVGTDGLLGARDYLAAQLTALGLRVSTPRFLVSGGETFNVVGEIAGSERPSDIYIVCGHYDSISEQPRTLAPGAEDNGSGAAGVIELARLFTANPPGATIRFILFSGEEVGLYGSRDYVDSLVAAREHRQVKGVINMDMIGYSGDDDLDVLLESDENGRELIEALARGAEAATSLRVVTSLTPFGSDHVPFIQAGIPAVLVIQNDWDSYPGYHRSTDTIENVRVDMGEQVLRMNAAALEGLAGQAEDPAITSVRYVRKPGSPQLLVDGNFAWQTSQIQIDGVPLDATIFREKFREGDRARRLVGRDASLETLVPRGIEVLVRVVDLRTDTPTAGFPFTR